MKTRVLNASIPSNNESALINGTNNKKYRSPNLLSFDNTSATSVTSNKKTIAKKT